jgi:hypothetical protein
MTETACKDWKRFRFGAWRTGSASTFRLWAPALSKVLIEIGGAGRSVAMVAIGGGCLSPALPSGQLTVWALATGHSSNSICFVLSAFILLMTLLPRETKDAVADRISIVLARA